MAVYKEGTTWRAVYRYTDWQGQRKQTQKRGFPTRREALAWEREQLSKTKADLDMTFSSFVEIYSEDMKSRIKENTWHTKEHILRTKILPYFGSRKISDIRPKDVIAWQNEMINTRDENGKDIADSCGLTIIIVHHTRKQKAEDICEMISGTNGLLGAADGALILSKEKRTDLEAVLEIVGRDQPEQRIQLRKEKESLIWEFVSAETELWKEPPDPLLERIAAALPADGSRWVGTASDLCQQLGLDLKPNALSLKLNVGAGRLMKEYGVYYRRGRTRESRRILLWKDESGGV